MFIWGAKQLRWCFSPTILLISHFVFGSSSLSHCLFPSSLLPAVFQQIWWLDPELTYGNAKPFVFTQGHSVCNRSFFPCFDTPAVKCTYSATVKVRDACGWFTELLVAVELCITCESIVTSCIFSSLHLLKILWFSVIKNTDLFRSNSGSWARIRVVPQR